ncbi:diacylglycerol/lipid kinase family protein [Aurantibacillus circumpalustris]|uniref:diacylglycerol/lipid kinase family protein n=1 Tax=Aurantibacillus circumpalustris TaxID=3036359 RepID=UPI00295C0673|nr:diacylglycerol kinase family lipid kinase [Aurantibacillus circumpalustris]
MQNTESITKSSAFKMPRKILFIVNPNAGKRISEKIIDAIKKNVPKEINYVVVIWKDKDHFEEITELLKTQGFTDAIAVGGDGTVNHVAKTILNTGITLGIVPIGSGNGLARSLGLSMKIDEVVRQIAQGKTTTIDSGSVNGIPFFCTSGIGFDAHIGNLFASLEKRGLQGYVKITFRELFKYRAKNYTIEFNGQTIQRKAFLITVANAGQYGNDFYIAPQANIEDGLFHIAILKPFNFFQVFGLMIKILSNKAHLSKHVETYSTNTVKITRDQKDTIHFDGDPEFTDKEVFFENKHQSLKVIVGEHYKSSKV